MKRLFIAILLLTAITEIQAQRVRVRIGRPLFVRFGTNGPAPYRNAVWIGPEWRWQRGQYVNVPGYWAKPRRYGDMWVPGHWKYTRRGKRWVPGRWR